MWPRSRGAAAQNPTAARATLERALAPPPAPWAYIELAYIEADARQRAEAWLAQAEKIAPEEAAVIITHAELCEQWQDYGCAEVAYQAALVKQPESGRLYSQLGNFYLPGAIPLAHQRWELAETYYRAAAEVWRPNDPWAHERLAYVLFNQQAYGEAAYRYQRTIDLAYNGTAPAGIYCNLGLAQQQAGQTAQAIEDYERCAKFATDDAQRAKAEELLKQVI